MAMKMKIMRRKADKNLAERWLALIIHLTLQSLMILRFDKNETYQVQIIKTTKTVTQRQRMDWSKSLLREQGFRWLIMEPNPYLLTRLSKTLEYITWKERQPIRSWKKVSSFQFMSSYLPHLIRKKILLSRNIHKFWDLKKKLSRKRIEIQF